MTPQATKGDLQQRLVADLTVLAADLKASRQKLKLMVSLEMLAHMAEG